MTFCNKDEPEVINCPNCGKSSVMMARYKDGGTVECDCGTCYHYCAHSNMVVVGTVHWDLSVRTPATRTSTDDLIEKIRFCGTDMMEVTSIIHAEEELPNKPNRCNLNKGDERCPQCGSKPIIAMLDGGTAECQDCNIEYHWCGRVNKNVVGHVHWA